MDHHRILDWASGHVESVEAMFRAFWEKKPSVLVTKYDHVSGEQVVRLRVRALPVQDEWTFRIGDTVHSLRVALDYLAYRIVAKYPGGPKAHKVGFPICDNGPKYAELEGRRIGRAVPCDIKKAIKALQPYHRLHAPYPEPLLLLDELENIHKHRRLLSAHPAIVGIQMVGSSTNVRITMSSLPQGPLNQTTELYRYVVIDPAAHRENDLQVRVTQHVCFDEAGPACGLPVIPTLKCIRDHLRDVVFPALDGYAS